MKRRLVIWATFLAGLYYVLVFVLPPNFGGDVDGAGASGGGPGPSDGSTARLYYTAHRKGQPPGIVSVAMPGPGTRRGSPRPVVVPSFLRRVDYQGAVNAQYVAPDRLYYVGLGWDDGTPRPCLARLSEGAWQPQAAALLPQGSAGTWDASGISWVSVQAPDQGLPMWRMWFIGRQGGLGRVGFATSRDGRRWTSRPVPVMLGSAGASIESVSVATWQGEDRAWLVERAPTDRAGQLLTVPVSSTSGEPTGSPEPVAWQAPELRFGNLPKQAIPILDARVVAAQDDARRLTLYATTMGADGRSSVTAADNVPLGGDRLPTVFIRRSPPLVSPGRPPHRNRLNELNPAVDDVVAVVGAFAIGMGLISLTQVHGRRIIRRQAGWPESGAFFAAVVSMAVFTFYKGGSPLSFSARAYAVLFYGLFQPLGSSVFALLAAYLVSASYRAFKVRTREAALMAAAAVLIMLGQVPVGNLLTQSFPHPLQIPTMMAWVLAVTNNGVIRAVNFGIFLGALATALRIWLSLDRVLHQPEL